MKDYELYLFDWDGTLTQTHDIALTIVKRQLGRYNVDLSDQQIVDRLFGRYQEGMLELHIPADALPALRHEIHAFLMEHMPLAPLYPDAESVLRRLHQAGRKLALVTATYREIVDLAMTNHKLAQLFDVIVAGDEVKAQKPDPDGLLIALRQLGIPADRAIMIGDSKKDILAGRQAGTDTLLFYPPEHETQHDLEDLLACRPTYVVHAWREMLDRLQ